MPTLPLWHSAILNTFEKKIDNISFISFFFSKFAPTLVITCIGLNDDKTDSYSF